MKTKPASAVLSSVLPLWGPPPDQTISEWADANRVLVSSSSAEPGNWITGRAEYQREPMDVITDPAIHTVVLMWSSQTGKSEILINAFGFFADLEPSPVLALQPTLEMAEAFSKDRFQPAVDACPALSEKIKPVKQKSSGNTIRHKKYPGGHITYAGANSAASLASRPIRIVAPDEVDRFPSSAGTEGDPVDLAWVRAETFYNRKLLLTSTPTDADVSRIYRAFKEGDQRYFNVPCPHCGEFQVLKFANLKWEKDDTDTAHFECVHCDGHIGEEHKPKMIAEGKWIATAPLKGTASFHIWAAYSPWKKWSEIASSFLRAKKTPETLKVWTNTTLGETWEDRLTSVVINKASDRTEPYDAEVPTGALCLTAGVDTQDNRLEISVYGWGLLDTPYAVDHVIIPGNTAGDKVWRELDHLLFDREFEWAYGGYLKIACTCIDSGGHRTEEVYKYVEPRQTRRVYAIKGSSGEGHPVIYYPTKRRTAQARVPVRLHMVGTDAGKTAVLGRLALPPGESGRSHFPDREPFDDGFFDQLTSEKCVTVFHAGHPKRVWKKKVSSARNEALDCQVYALAAVHKLRPNWRALEKRANAVSKGEALEDEPQKKTRQPRRRKGFVNSWRK